MTTLNSLTHELNLIRTEIDRSAESYNKLKNLTQKLQEWKREEFLFKNATKKITPNLIKPIIISIQDVCEKSEDPVVALYIQKHKDKLLQSIKREMEIDHKNAQRAIRFWMGECQTALGLKEGDKKTVDEILSLLQDQKDHHLTIYQTATKQRDKLNALIAKHNANGIN